MTYSLVVFDWDGTVMDSTHSIVVAIQQTCRDLEITVPTDQQASWVIGLSLTEALRKAVPDLGDHNIDRFIERYRYHYFTRDTDLRLFAGMRALLERLKAGGIQLAVATGKSRRGLDRGIMNHQLAPLFDMTRTAEETASKPDPLMLHEIMQELDVAPQHVVMVGDTTHDIEMAHHAGVDSFAVTYGAHSRHDLMVSKPTKVAENVSELARLLELYCKV